MLVFEAIVKFQVELFDKKMSDEPAVEFDNIGKSQRTERRENENNGLVKFISNLPCLPGAQPKPDTPNIDKVNSSLCHLLAPFFRIKSTVPKIDQRNFGQVYAS